MSETTARELVMTLDAGSVELEAAINRWARENGMDGHEARESVHKMRALDLRRRRWGQWTITSGTEDDQQREVKRARKMLRDTGAKVTTSIKVNRGHGFDQDGAAFERCTTSLNWHRED